MEFSPVKFEVIMHGNFEDDEIREIYNFLKEALFSDVILTIYKHELPPTAYNSYRNQYNGSRLLVWILSLKTDHNSYLIGLIDEDGYVEGLNFIFGIASRLYKAALVFTKRLRHRDKGIYLERIKKEIVHELGHLFGLEHCKYEKCVMYFSNTLLDTDRKTWKFCDKCLYDLKKNGYKINERILRLY